MIEVPCEPHDLLNWNLAEAPTYWKLNLGFEKIPFPIRDEIVYAALKLAVEKFSKELLPLGGEGVILYQGSIDFVHALNWDAALLEQYHEWLSGDDSIHARRCFALDCFGNYFQMIAHLLPDETPIFLLLEPLQSSSETLALLSRPTLEHFQIALQNPPFFRRGWRWDQTNIWKVEDSPKKGFLLPDGAHQFERFDALSSGCELLIEQRLNEEWDGLEEIDLPVEKLSVRGERMLLGFIAAGGKINRGRGI